MLQKSRHMIEKLSEIYKLQQLLESEILYHTTDSGIPYCTLDLDADKMESGFIKGFLKCREMAEQIWLDKDHLYCDFYYVGLDKVKALFPRDDS
jgi:hypothetical protein